MTQSPAQFAVRTMRALEVLAFGPMTAPKLADHLGVHPRTARRLLSQLQRDGWLFYNRGVPPTYAPTLRLVALAANIGARSPLSKLTAPALARLHADTGLPAMLAIPAYDATVCLARCVGGETTNMPLGVVEPAHRNAAGKVLLAAREQWRCSVLDRLVDIDIAEFERELEQVARAGFAITSHGSAMQVAAPIGLPESQPLAAIAVVGAEIERTSARPLRSLVCAAAADASAALSAAGLDAPLHGMVVYRELASHGLTAVNAYL